MADCPVCGKPQAQAFKPFCSKRCADIDLNRWLKGGYAIPGGPAGSVNPIPETSTADNMAATTMKSRLLPVLSAAIAMMRTAKM